MDERVRLVVRVGPEFEDIRGYVDAGGCENERCMRAQDEGRQYHAIPRVGTLPDYHFATVEEAVDALL